MADKPTPVHLLTVLIVDTDHVGAESIPEILRDARYPNRCISPEVIASRTVEVEWSDDHPLNRHDTTAAEVQRLFPGDLMPMASLRNDYRELERQRDALRVSFQRELDSTKAVLAATDAKLAESRKLVKQAQAGEGDSREACALASARAGKAEADLATARDKFEKELTFVKREHDREIANRDAAHTRNRELDTELINLRNDHRARLEQLDRAGRELGIERANASKAALQLGTFVSAIDVALGGSGCRAPEMLIAIVANVWNGLRAATGGDLGSAPREVTVSRGTGKTLAEAMTNASRQRRKELQRDATDKLRAAEEAVSVFIEQAFRDGNSCHHGNRVQELESELGGTRVELVHAKRDLADREAALVQRNTKITELERQLAERDETIKTLYSTSNA